MSGRRHAAGVQRVDGEALAEGLARKLSACDGAALEDEHFLPRLREVIRRDQAVVAGADDEGVASHVRAHFQSFSTSCAASLPAAPITPPPGCAPAAPK